MNPETLDLDAIVPSPKTVIFGGVERQVLPPKMSTLAQLMSLASSFSNVVSTQDTETASTAIESLKSALLPIVPWINDEGVDMSLEQLLALFNFIVGMATPTENKVLAEHGLEPIASDDKKGGDSSEPMSTSSEDSQGTEQPT